MNYLREYITGNICEKKEAVIARMVCESLLVFGEGIFFNLLSALFYLVITVLLQKIIIQTFLISDLHFHWQPIFCE